MEKQRDQQRETEEIRSTPVKQEENAKPRSGAFNEPGPETQKSTTNAEEADLEQERKEAMTERD
jgi:hypothetical protein